MDLKVSVLPTAPQGPTSYGNNACTIITAKAVPFYKSGCTQGFPALAFKSAYDMPGMTIVFFGRAWLLYPLIRQ